MIRYRTLHSILQTDGINVPVHIDQWAEQRLNEEEYLEFRTEMQEVYDEYARLQNLDVLEIVPVMETFQLDNDTSMQVEVGKEATFSENIVDYLLNKDSWDTEKHHHLNMIKWYQRMKNDSSIVKFNEPTRIQ
jgi:hypothetical protein